MTFQKKTCLILILNLDLKLGQARNMILCSKDTAKDTGLNVWLDPDPDAHGLK